MAQSTSSALHLLDRHRLLLHLGLPAAVALLLVAAFFSGAGWLTRAVVPATPRDFGVLELLQVATLGLATWTAWQAARSARGRRRARWGFAVLGGAAALLLLDELHYGRQLYDVLTDAAPAARAGAGEASSAVLWPGLDRWLLVGLVALPLIAAAGRAAGLHWGAVASRWVPSGWHATTLALMLGAAMLVRMLGEADGTGELTLGRLLAGLRELGLYYLGALLVLEAAARRGLSPQVRFCLPPALVISAGRRRQTAAVPPPPPGDGPPRLVVIRGGAVEAAAHAPARTPTRSPAGGAPTAGGGAAARRHAPLRPTPAAGTTRTLGAAGRLASWTSRAPLGAPARGTTARGTTARGTTASGVPRPPRAAPPADREVTPIALRRRWLRPMLPGVGADDRGESGEDGGGASHDTGSSKNNTTGGPTFESPAR